jgi:hypothetical protein
MQQTKIMIRNLLTKNLFFILTLFSTSGVLAQQRKAPAYPLITHDPYFSIWTGRDSLNTGTTTHWTGAAQPLTGILSVDGKLYSFLGKTADNYSSILPSGQKKDELLYTETEPEESWNGPNFNTAGWKPGVAPFGSGKGPVETIWKTKDLWVRKILDLKTVPEKAVYLKLSHDDDVEIQINGKPFYKKNGWTDDYLYLPIDKKLLHTGKNLLSIHITNTVGGALLDFDLVEQSKNKNFILAAEQKNVSFNATKTVYDFVCGGINLTVKFTSPLLMDDLILMGRPISYISTAVKANDGKKHQVSLYFGASTKIAVHDASQPVKAISYTKNGLKILKAGTLEQPILKRVGDNVRIDWGAVYVSVESQANVIQTISDENNALNIFSTKAGDTNAEVSGKALMLNTMIPIGNVGTSIIEKYIMIGYDELYAVQYFQKNLRPWWNLTGTETIEHQFLMASKQYKTIMKKCSDFDKKLYKDAFKSGGEHYARLCELAYRQAISAHALTKSPEGEILFLSKENFSNGSINTVDVTYPSAPLFLIYNPELLKGMLNGIFHYSENGLWKKPYAPHDLGTYPIANGQTYGGDMPVEESGNMLILCAGIAKVEGNAAYAKKHWKALTTWAEYLNKEGFDPANQLSTDDFAGHLARNTNLSIKSITALACYARLSAMLGDNETAKKYNATAKGMAIQWMKMADAGDHYSLTFDRKDTWSQKYNLIWDKLLKLDIFPKEVYKKEVDFYLTKQNLYGLPLDSRETYTKSDWVIWSATLSDNRKDFEALVSPMYKYALETTDRVPLSDNHRTLNGRRRNFTARSVVGGYYIKILQDKLK